MSTDPINDLRKMRDALVATRRNLAAKGEKFVSTQEEIDAIDRALVDEQAMQEAATPKPQPTLAKRTSRSRVR